MHARDVGEARLVCRKVLRAWRVYSRGANPNSRNELSASQNGKGAEASVAVSGGASACRAARSLCR